LPVRFRSLPGGPPGTLGEVHRRWQATAQTTSRACRRIKSTRSPRSAGPPAPANPLKPPGHLDGQGAGLQAWRAPDRAQQRLPVRVLRSFGVCGLSLRRTERCRSSRPPWRAYLRDQRITAAFIAAKVLRPASVRGSGLPRKPGTLTRALNTGLAAAFLAPEDRVATGGGLGHAGCLPSGETERTADWADLEDHVGLSARNRATIAGRTAGTS
jgi:hypothetical protein